MIGDFLQQFFTFVVGSPDRLVMGGKLSWALLLFIPVVVTSARKIGREVRTPHPHRPGQAGRDSEHSARNRDRQPHREGLQH